MNPEHTPASSEPDYDQPVAYDTNGKPLYARPASAAPTPPPAPAGPATPPAPQVVHMTRPIDPVKAEVSPAVQARHERSRRLYPQLNLSAGEYVISAVRRHPIGLFIPLTVGVFLIALALIFLMGYSSFVEYFDIRGASASPDAPVLPVLLFIILTILGMIIVYYVYISNKFYLTNESVIQEIQVSLFARKEQTVSLANIEDASYTQHGIIQTIFNYGAIRLSTEGDETTYRFTYVASPKTHIRTLNNAVEAFKNGRPVDPDEL